MRWVSFCLLAGVGVLGCGGRSGLPASTTGDGLDMWVKQPGLEWGTGDGPSKPVKPGQDSGSGVSGCGADCHEYVVTLLDGPTTSTEVSKHAFIWKGKSYNALGNLLMVLTSQFMPTPKVFFLAEGICSGKALNLLRVKAGSLQNGQATLQTWTGSASCCTAATCSDATTGQCLSGAKAACFSGSAQLTPEAAPQSYLHSGTLSNSILSSQGSLMRLKLVFSPMSAPLVLDLLMPQIRGRMTAAAIQDGTLAGAIRETHFNQVFLPWLATIINDLLTNPNTDPKTRQFLKQIFDTDQNGVVTAQELANNPLFKSLGKGDVDANGDGLSDISMGLGLGAVRCTIKAP